MNNIELPSPSKRFELKRSNSSPSNLNHHSIPSYETLTPEYFDHLIKVEYEFHNKTYNVQTLDELVQLYARAVEYFDSIQEGISSYFAFKIQDILATKRSLEILYNQNNSRGKKNAAKNLSVKSPIRSPKKSKSVIMNGFNLLNLQPCSPTRQDYLEDGSDDERENLRKISLIKPKPTKRHDSLSSLKSQKQRYVQFFHMVEEGKANYQQNMHVVIDEHKKVASQNDSVVLSGIDKQKQRLQEKLNKRKNEKLVSYTMNNSMQSFMSGRSMAAINEHLMKKEFGSPYLVGDLLSELDDSMDADNKKEKSGSFTDMVGPIPSRKSCFAKSIFARKEESARVDTDNDVKEEEEEESQVKAKPNNCTTPTGKLSTENSFTANINEVF